METKTQAKPAPVPKSNVPMVVDHCKKVIFHTPIMFCGHTETAISYQKHRKLIKSLGWTQKGQMLLVDSHGEVHLIPSAQVVDSILE